MYEIHTVTPMKMIPCKYHGWAFAMDEKIAVYEIAYVDICMNVIWSSCKMFMKRMHLS